MSQVKRTFIMSLAAVVCVSCGGGSGSTYNDGSLGRTDNRPNIIFIFTDREFNSQVQHSPVRPGVVH